MLRHNATKDQIVSQLAVWCLIYRKALEEIRAGDVQGKPVDIGKVTGHALSCGPDSSVFAAVFSVDGARRLLTGGAGTVELTDDQRRALTTGLDRLPPVR